MPSSSAMSRPGTTCAASSTRCPRSRTSSTPPCRGRRSLTNPAIRCIGIAINTEALEDTAARDYLRRTSRAHRLPAVDPIRTGVGAADRSPWRRAIRPDHAAPHRPARELAACRRLHHRPGVQDRRRSGDRDARAGRRRRPRRMRALCPLWRNGRGRRRGARGERAPSSSAIAIARRCRRSSSRQARPATRSTAPCGTSRPSAAAGRCGRLAGLPQPRPLVTAYTLSLARPAAMGEAAAAAAGRPLLKLKLGGRGRPRAAGGGAPQRAGGAADRRCQRGLG